jgi:hypothetical protein
MMYILGYLRIEWHGEGQTLQIGFGGILWCCGKRYSEMLAPKEPAAVLFKPVPFIDAREASRPVVKSVPAVRPVLKYHRPPCLL